MAYLKKSQRKKIMRPTILTYCIRQLSSHFVVPKICIIGAGPAGFYAAQQLLKTSTDAQVDILERLPVPFGLVRFGVAPDHPEVKNVIHTFHKTAKNPRVQFLGNINVGKDISIDQLKENYHAILLTYGAEEDKFLNIPGEDLKNVVSARNFVGWYNGLPNDKNFKIDLNTEEAVILGQGNVGIDVARMLLTPIDKLKTTDITSYALEQLSQSKIKKVYLVGRRGPLQAAFTIAELREMLKLENCKTCWRPKDFTGLENIVPNLARPRKRLTELMLKSLNESTLETRKCEKEFHPVFLRGPLEFKGSDSVEKVKFSVNNLEGDDILHQTAKMTSEVEEFPCGLAVRSIGYKSVQIDESIPFDSKSGRVLADNVGTVDGSVFAAGWVATGPVGVILTTMTNAFNVGANLSKQLNVSQNKAGFQGLNEILRKKNVQVVTYEGWEKIDKVECEMGKKCNKPREKIVNIDEMLRIANN